MPSDSEKPLLVTMIWLVVVGFGMTALMRYGQTPGVPGEPPPVWPDASALSAPGALPKLVMLVHPRCPCSRASLSELERLTAKAKGAMDAHVLFFQPDEPDASWRDTDLWRTARRMPGVTVSADPMGREADLFGAHTSGQTVLYSAVGELLFSGGLTPGRGHEGDNSGTTAILANVRGAGAVGDTYAVYGCPIQAVDVCLTDEESK